MKISIKSFLLRAASASEIKVVLPDVPKAYALVNLNFIWNEGSDAEAVHPTLEMVFVPTRYRGKGHGESLVMKTLQELKKRRVKYVVFDNYEEGFWSMFKKKHPEIRLEFRRSKRQGIIFLSPSATKDSVDF